jgi:hypothetical protein
VAGAELNSDFNRFFPFVFPLFFAGMWLFVTTILAVKSGWFSLVRKYPDKKGECILRLLFQSGSMSGVSMKGILRLETCDSGLRVGIWKMFGPFNRDFFVPWNEISVERKNQFIWKVAKLNLGSGGQDLTLQNYVADRLARSVPTRWPEEGPFPEQTYQEAAWGVFKLWAVVTIFAALFFTVVPRLMSANGAYPPIMVAIGFPAIFFGIAALINFFSRMRR